MRLERNDSSGVAPKELDLAQRQFEPPTVVIGVLERLWDAGHGAFVVGGGVRDALLDRTPSDWDVATSALPQQLLQLFDGAHYENRFGTVTVDAIQITTFRQDHQYQDRRRPDAVTFTDSIEQDLGRRDFTVNAIAWGRRAGARDAVWVDPSNGFRDLRDGVIRTVGDADRRFDEDALRLLRAVRLAVQLDFSIEPQTLAGVQRAAELVRHVSAERVKAELDRLVMFPRPARGFRLLEESGLLPVILPELAAQIGVAQRKVPGHDLWDHSLATLDAAASLAPDHRILRLAALLHDLGKPATAAGDRFIGHETVGAEQAAALLDRLREPRRSKARIVRLIRWHMFGYEPTSGDAAVRRLLRRVGPDLIDELLLLRAADNLGSGRPATAGDLDGLRSRIDEQRDAGVPLTIGDLAIDGRELVHELGRTPGPWVGRSLERLLEIVIEDPERNSRAELLRLAQGWSDLARSSEPA